MKKYRVEGTTVVTVRKEVWANSEEEALQKAYDELDCLTAYCGNGGDDKMVGVEGEGESVEAFDNITYDDAIELEDDPNYFECVYCNEKCEECERDDGTEYWHCSSCDAYYDEDGDEFFPDVYEED